MATIEPAALLRRPGGGLAAAAPLAWLARQLEAERERWALWLPVAFAVGIGLYFGQDAEPPPWLGAAAVALALLVTVLCRGIPAGFVAALALSAMAAGFLAAQARSAWVEAPILAKRLGPVWLTGEIQSLEPRAKGVRLVLGRLEIARLEPHETPARVRIAARSAAPGLRPGDRVRVRAVLNPPPEPAVPGAFDFARQAYFQRLGAVGFAFGAVRPAEARPATRAGPGWDLWWSGLRNDLARRIGVALPGQAGALAAALMTGERGAISGEVMRAMRDSGLAHLLAISGLHLGLIAGLLFLGLRAALALSARLALDRPIKKWAAVGAAGGAFAYLMLTGATIPTQRAFLMLALVLLAVVLDCSALSMRLVAWAALVVLALAPESLLSASFQLSFAAVAALIAAYEVARARRSAWLERRGLGRRLARYGAGVVLTSLIAGLATAPFALYHFNRIAWYGLAANLVAVPLTALWIMPWALVAFCLMPFGAERLALVPMGWGIDLMLEVAAGVAGWPGATSVAPAMPTYGLVLIALGGAWLCLWWRPWRLAGLAGLVAGIFSLALLRPPDLLVSGDGRLFGLRAPDGGLLLSSAAVRRFDAEVWGRRLGEEESAVWPAPGIAADAPLTCYALGCIYRAAGQVVALVGDARALAEDCALASVVVSGEPLGRAGCRGPRLVIDRFDLWRQGAHALWLDPSGARVESVNERRGRRPWVAQRGAGAYRSAARGAVNSGVAGRPGGPGS